MTIRIGRSDLPLNRPGLHWAFIN